MQSILWAATGTGFTFLMTTLGAAMVFLFRKQLNASIQRIFLGFAAGVMIAASVWSLLIPAMEEAEASGLPGWLPAVGGFVLGIGFLLLLDVLLPHLHVDARQPEGLHSSWRRTTLLVLAVTLHNIPEGMAVGLSFALAAQHAGEGAACPGLWRWLWELESRTSRRGRPSPCPCGRRGCPPGGLSSTAAPPAWWSLSSVSWWCWWRGRSSPSCPGCCPSPPGP